MTIDEFAAKMFQITRSAQERLGPTGNLRNYGAVPIFELQRIWEKHRIINFRTPNDHFQLLYGTLGFVTLSVIQAMKDRYFAALEDPSSWERIAKEFEAEADRLVVEVFADLDGAIARDPEAGLVRPNWSL